VTPANELLNLNLLQMAWSPEGLLQVQVAYRICRVPST